MSKNMSAAEHYTWNSAFNCSTLNNILNLVRYTAKGILIINKNVFMLLNFFTPVDISKKNILYLSLTNSVV